MERSRRQNGGPNMDSKANREPGFRGEFLWEYDFVHQQLTALASAIPSDRFDWRPAERARSVSEVLVHVAAGNLVLLDMTGIRLPPGLYDGIEGDGLERFFNLIERNEKLEKTITGKTEVVRLLGETMARARECFGQATDLELERSGNFFGEQTTVRRVYLRLLLHMNEHMGQIVAYVRSMGMPVPWPAWQRPSKQG